MDNSRPVLQPGPGPWPGTANKAFYRIGGEGREERMTLLRTLASDGKEPSSSPCSKSGRAEINGARKMPLKHLSQRATEHSGVYIFSAVYFPPPLKRAIPSALFQHDTCSSLWIAMEDSWGGGRCTGDRGPCWDTQQGTPSTLGWAWERTARQQMTGRTERHHPRTFTGANYSCTALQVLSNQKEATAEGSS